jgi:hypothetical protein
MVPRQANDTSKLEFPSLTFLIVLTVAARAARHRRAPCDPPSATDGGRRAGEYNRKRIKCQCAKSTILDCVHLIISCFLFLTCTNIVPWDGRNKPTPVQSHTVSKGNERQLNVQELARPRGHLWRNKDWAPPCKLPLQRRCANRSTKLINRYTFERVPALRRLPGLPGALAPLPRVPAPGSKPAGTSSWPCLEASP